VVDVNSFRVLDSGGRSGNCILTRVKLRTLVEAKGIIAKSAIGGILIGVIILFGVMKLNQSSGNALGSRSANTLVAENNFLRQQVSLFHSG